MTAQESQFETVDGMPALEWTDLFAIVRRRAVLIVAVFVVVMGLAVAYSWLSAPTYRAEAAVTIKQPNVPAVPTELLSLLGGTTPTPLEAQQWLLRNPRLIERVAKELNLKEPVPRILKHISVLPLGTSAVLVRVEDQDREAATRLANALVERHIQQSGEQASADERKAMVFLEQQLLDAQKRLRATEDSLRDFKSERQLADPTIELTNAVALLSDLSKQITAARAADASATQTAAYYRGRLQEADEKVVSSTTIARNALIGDIEGRLSALEGQRLTQSATRGPEHPEVRRLEREIDATRAELAAAVKTVVTNRVEVTNPAHADALTEIAAGEAEALAAEARQRALQTVMEQQTARLSQLPNLQMDLTRLQRDATLAAELYTRLMTSYEGARLKLAEDTPPVSILALARPPDRPVRPNKMLNLILGVVAAGGLALMLLVALEVMSDVVRNEKHADHVLNLPLLATIPATREAAIPLPDRGDHSTPFVDAFRTLRADLQLMGALGPHVALLVAGTQPHEGRSTVAANLAWTLAQGRHRTLLVDGNLRAPRLAQLLKVEGQPGLAELLAGQRELEQCVVPTRWEQLHVLPAGTAPEGPAELLESPQAQAVFQALRERYDVVVVDSPAWHYPDNVLLASLCDQALLVVHTGKTAAKHLHRLVEQLRLLGKAPLGFVVRRG